MNGWRDEHRKRPMRKGAFAIPTIRPELRSPPTCRSRADTPWPFLWMSGPRHDKAENTPSARKYEPCRLKSDAFRRKRVARKMEGRTREDFWLGESGQAPTGRKKINLAILPSRNFWTGISRVHGCVFIFPGGWQSRGNREVLHTTVGGIRMVFFYWPSLSPSFSFSLSIVLFRFPSDFPYTIPRV